MVTNPKEVGVSAAGKEKDTKSFLKKKNPPAEDIKGENR